jgi:cytochrome P450
MRKTIAAATEAAGTRGCDEVAVEHLLEAVIADPTAAGGFVFERAGVSRDSLIAHLRQSDPPTFSSISRADRFSSKALHVLDVAAGEADRLGHKHVGTEHVAVAMAKLDHLPLGQWLRENGLTPEKADVAAKQWVADKLARKSPATRGTEHSWLGRLPRPVRVAFQFPRLAWGVVGGKSLIHPGFVWNPYPLYDSLRNQSAVRRDPVLPVWVVTGYTEVASVLKDGRFKRDPFSAARLPAGVRGQLGIAGGQPRTPGITSESMLFLDPPAHTRVRSFFAKAFTPKMMQGLRPRIQQITDKLIDRVLAGGSKANLIDAIAYPLPVVVIAELLGFPPEDFAKYKKWSDDFASELSINPSVQQQAAAAQSRAELAVYFDALADKLEKEPADNLLSALLFPSPSPGIPGEASGSGDCPRAGRGEGDFERREPVDNRRNPHPNPLPEYRERGPEIAPLTREELFLNATLLLAAGHETTTNWIGNGIRALLRNREQYQRLVADPSLIDSAVEELLRFDSPVQWVSRIAAERVELGGKVIDPGDIILASLGAANRDPAVFDSPNAIDLGRADNKHLSFGGGVHFCLGAVLARYEAQIAIGTIIRRLPNLKLRPGVTRWKRGVIFRAMRRLDVSFDRGSVK